ncbi:MULTISPECIES: hypothetical protein [Bacillus]|uniref:hypothetical protein n=1 Tax=Bacillus TaxID=1386 RepID=UPI000B4A9E88|nr:hypothetical protein [Bacillus cereus]
MELNKTSNTIIKGKLNVFEETWNKKGSYLTAYNNRGEFIVGIQIGTESNYGCSYELGININITNQKWSGFAMNKANLSNELISAARKMAEEIALALYIPDVFGGR